MKTPSKWCAISQLDVSVALLEVMRLGGVSMHDSPNPRFQDLLHTMISTLITF